MRVWLPAVIPGLGMAIGAMIYGQIFQPKLRLEELPPFPILLKPLVSVIWFMGILAVLFLAAWTAMVMVAWHSGKVVLFMLSLTFLGLSIYAWITAVRLRKSQMIIEQDRFTLVIGDKKREFKASEIERYGGVQLGMLFVFLKGEQMGKWVSIDFHHIDYLATMFQAWSVKKK